MGDDTVTSASIRGLLAEALSEHLSPVSLTLAKLDVSMGELPSFLSHCMSEIAAVDEKILQMEKRMDNDIGAPREQFRRLAEDSSNVSSSGNSDGPPAKRHWGSVGSSAASTMASEQSRRSSSVPPSVAAQPARTLRTKVWVRGFTDPQLRIVLEEQAHRILKLVLPTMEISMVKIIARTAEAHFAVDFATEDKAFEFVRQARVLAITFEDQPLRFQLDQTYEERQMGWVLSKVYAPLNTHLQLKGSVFQIGVDKRKGWVFVSINRKCLVYFATSKLQSGPSTSWSLEPRLDTLAELGITEDVAKAWIAGIESGIPSL